MILNESSIKKIFKEEYEKRIVSVLLERTQIETSDGINVWLDANPLKVVHDKSGIVFSFFDINDDKVRLLMPYESRASKDVNQSNSSNLLLQHDSFEEKYNFGERKYDELEEKDFFTIDVKTFESEFSRA
jgi:hypothetical protein